MTKVRKNRFGPTENDYLYKFHEDLLNYKEKLDSFITESQSTLKGGGFDALRKVLNYYSDLISYAANLYLYTYNSFNSANAQMYEFMEDYDVLNDKYLIEVKSEYNKAKDEINNLSAGFPSAYSVEYLVNQLQSLPPLINKLETLAPTDSRLAGSLSDTKSKITAFSKHIQRMKITQIDEFKS